MCRNRPGPRCTDHSRQAMNKAGGRILRVQTEIKELIERIKTAVADSKTEANLKAKLKAKEVEKAELDHKFDEAKLDYDATPGGRQELKDKLEQDNITAEEKEFLQMDLDAAEARRKWQNEMNAKLTKAVKSGGIVSGMMIVQIEMGRQDERLAEIRAKLVQARQEQEHINRESRTPKGRHPSNANRWRQSQERSRKIIYFFRKQELLQSLMRDDLDSYFKRQSKKRMRKLTRHAFVGTVKAATKLIK